MSRIRALIEYVPVRVLAFCLELMPRGAALAVGRLAGRLWWRLDREHRRVALENLRHAYGETLDREGRERIARGAFEHFGMVAVDCLLMKRLGPRDLDRIADIEGVDHIRKAFLKGKGVLVFSGHFGNWEMVALLQGWLGYPMAMITRPLDNPFLEGLLRRRRQRSGNVVIHKRNAAREALRALRNAWCVAIVIDQDTRGTDCLFVDFFGRPAATTPALARIALRTGAPIVPVFGLPAPGGRYTIRYLPEVTVESTGDKETDILALTRACTAIIEKEIRAAPHAWLWMHKRWKRRPGGRRGDGASAPHEALQREEA